MKYFYDCEFVEDGKTIDLISIGIVAEDGRVYYAQSAEFLEHGKPNEWVQQHVIPCLGPDWIERDTILHDILAFINPATFGTPELWGYYSAYDHVAFCQLFGTMMDLPDGFPWITYDLRQWLDSHFLNAICQPDDAPHHALEDAHWIAWTYKAYEPVSKRQERSEHDERHI